MERHDTQVKITPWLEHVSAPRNGENTHSPELLHFLSGLFFLFALQSVANTYVVLKLPVTVVRLSPQLLCCLFVRQEQLEDVQPQFLLNPLACCGTDPLSVSRAYNGCIRGFTAPRVLVSIACILN